MTVNEVSELTGVSVRTLHHYDAISLLSPRRNRGNGYREYGDTDLDKLQQILFFKECGFSLAKIKELLNRPDFDRTRAFTLQKKYLIHEQKRINTMLENLEQSLKHLKGDFTMSQKDKFMGFDLTCNPYEVEARQLWGNQAVDNSNAHIASLSYDERGAVAKSMDDLFSQLSKYVHESPDSPAVQAAMTDMYGFFNRNFGHQYSLDAFAGLGELYISDQRFTENIDQYAPGLSAFLAKAMRHFADCQR
ncbi:MAG: transcriptional regulator, MerR family [Firmicutes bacterium]|nr:transcriptional regulator, MerR family [Bacillota bacterium]